MKRSLRRLAIGFGSALIVYVFAIAILLMIDPGPPTPRDGSDNLDFADLAKSDLADLPPLRYLRAGDGAKLAYRFYPAETHRVLLLVHGSGYHGRYLHPLAEALSKRDIAQVMVPNMRGHFKSGRTQGDLPHLGQLIADTDMMIAAIRKQVPRARLIVGGHSSGGGFILRYLAERGSERVLGALLLAPYLGHDALTTRPNSGGWAHANVPRIIGLSMLNSLGITRFNGLTTLRFAMPRSVRDGTETLSYSYRMMVAFGPPDIARLDGAIKVVPTLLIVGTSDRAMVASAYTKVISASPNVQIEAMQGLDHFGVVLNPIAIDAIAAWLHRR